MMTTAMISIAAQHAPADPAQASNGAQFYIFDGSPADSRNAGLLARLDGVIPHPVNEVTWRGLSAVIAELAAEVERRQKDAGEAPAIYLFVYDLQRYRDLRKSDDDFGFSRHGEDKETPRRSSSSTSSATAPPVGVHTLVWCDSLNNLNRAFDRQALRGVRDPRPLPDERQRLEQFDRLARGRQARPQPRSLLQRGGRAAREVPALRPPRRRVARLVRRQFQDRQAPVVSETHATHGFTPESSEIAEA